MVETNETMERDLRFHISAVSDVALLAFGVHGDGVWLLFMAPRIATLLVLDVTITSARTNSSVPAVEAPLPFHVSPAAPAQQGKLEVDLRTAESISTPTVQFAPGYYPFAFDARRLALMAVEIVYRLAIMGIVRRFSCMGANVGFRSSCFDSYTMPT
jgi:hypothetical protein